MLLNFLPPVPQREGMTLWEELFHYFDDRYFTPQFGAYDNFEVASGTLLSVKMIVIGLVVGLVWGALMSLYNKRVLGEMVYRLLKRDGVGVENAKTLSELELMNHRAIRMSLRRGHTLRRVVKCVEEEAYWGDNAEKAATAPRSAAFRMDFATAHFYIPEKDKYAAEMKFRRKGTDWLTFGITVVLSVLFLVLAMYFLPDLFQMLDNFINLVG